MWLSQIGTSEPVKVITQGKVPAQNPGAIRRVGLATVTSGSRRSDPVLIHLDGAVRAANLVVFWPTQWSRRGRLTEKAMAYHTVEPGDPIFVVDRSGRSLKIFTAKSGDQCVTI